MQKEQLRKEFYQLYGREGEHPVEFFFSPGRVCLIGEHIDYNGGLVMTAGLSLGITAAFRKTDNKVIWMRSTLDSHDEVVPLTADLHYQPERTWGNYPLGVVKYLREAGYQLSGCEVLFHSEMPVGAGLSSSAAVEMLTAYLFTRATDDKELIELAQLAQKAENQFVRMQCGIMDQYSVGLAKEGHAMVINCDTLEHEQVPLALEGYSLLLLNTRAERKLTDSKYNERRAESARALEILQDDLRINKLVDATEDSVHRLIHDPVIRNRALHTVREHQRVIDAAVALKAGKLEAFGKLMNESHRSLSELYEVAGPHLDAFVHAAWQHPACIGAKMSGGGFGGCAVALVQTEAVADFSDFVLQQYQQKTDLKGEVYEAQAVGRVGEMREN